MIAKKEEKDLALRLRREGRTYSEILEQVSVAKSTLSLWLKAVGLNKGQQQRITQKRLDAAKRGGIVKRKQRIVLTQEIKNAARKEINNITNRELWLMGVIMYWAEGEKEKEWKPGSPVGFINSDPYVIKLFLRWLIDILGVDSDDLVFRVYIHENSINRIDAVYKYWSNITGFSLKRINKVYFKKHNVKTARKNIGNDYFGLLQIKVRRSSSLNRKIAGWIEGIGLKI